MCLLLLTLPPATQSQLSLNPWLSNHPVHLVFVFGFFPLCLEVLMMTSDYALGFYALFAPFLLPRESLDLEHVISLWSYSICFLTSWVWVCACQTFTVFKVIPVGLLILAFTGLLGKSNITLPTNSQDLCAMQFQYCSQMSTFSVRSHNIYFSSSHSLFPFLTGFFSTAYTV